MKPAWISMVLALAATAAQATVWDVTKYGAKPGDTKDDTTAINAVIQKAKAGDTVLLPAGSYRLSKSLKAKSGITISGAGYATTTLTWSSTAHQSMLDVGACSNVELTGFTLDGGGKGYANQGIDVSGGTNEYFHALRVQNLGGGSRYNDVGPHAFYCGDMSSSKIENCILQNLGVESEWGAGIRLTGGANNTISGNTITNTGRGGILCNDNSTGLVIRGNTISGSGKAGTALGIELWHGCDNAIVEDNTMDHWLSLDTCSRVAVRDNVVSDTSTHLSDCGLEMAGGGHDVIFSGNTVNGGAQVGISVSAGAAKERVYWTHNTITAAVTWGAQIQGDQGGARQMYFYANTITGTTGGKGAWYAGQGNAFRFNGNCQQIDLEANVLTKNAGIAIQGGNGKTLDKLRVVGNTITGNKGAAWTKDYGTPGAFVGSNLLWTGNAVSGNGNNYQPASKGSFYADMPSVSIEAPATATIGESVQFDCLFSGPYSAASTLWDLGDGIPETTREISHTYHTAGTYTIGLVVWDSQGRAAHAEVPLTVTAGSGAKPVPEPGTAALLAAAIVVLVGWKSRRT